MANELLADKILRWLGNNPAAYPQADDKWPVIFADIFFYSLPYIFGLLFFSPFIWMLIKKKKFTLKTTGMAALQGVGLMILGVVVLYLLASYLQGQAFKALNGG